MNKRIILTISICMSLVVANAQTQTPGEYLAQKQARYLTDSIGLTEQQRQQIYEVNLELLRRKMLARQQNAGNRPVIAQQLQTIENQRDSMYKVVIASDEKYRLYKSKKVNILRAN